MNFEDELPSKNTERIMIEQYELLLLDASPTAFKKAAESVKNSIPRNKREEFWKERQMRSIELVAVLRNIKI